MSRTDLPPVSSPNFLEKVREALSVYLGYRGNDLDRGLTVRDLTDAGAAGKVINAAIGTAVAGISVAGSANLETIIGALTLDLEADLSAPPTPYSFTATAAISNLMVQCAAPSYTAGHGHYRSVLYGATWVSGALPVFGNAVVLSEFAGQMFSYATNPSTTWHLWLKWMSRDGVLSSNPAGGTNGVVVSTGQDVSSMVAAMTGAGNPFTILAAPTTLGGVTFPAGTYSTQAFIRDAQITTAKIGALAVDTANLAAAAITTAKIGDAQITTAKIDLAQITTALIDTAAITTAKINDAAITTAKINDAAITTAKIGTAQITTALIADATITSAKLGTAAIDTASIGTAVVTTLKIGANNVSIGVGASVNSQWLTGTYYGTGETYAGSGAGNLVAGMTTVATLNINTEGYPIYGLLTCQHLRVIEAAVGGIPVGAYSYAELQVWITNAIPGFAGAYQHGSRISGYLQPQFGDSYVWPFPDIIYGAADSKAMSFVVPNPGLGSKTIDIRLYLYGDGSSTLKTVQASNVSFFAIGLKR